MGSKNIFLKKPIKNLNDMTTVLRIILSLMIISLVMISCDRTAPKSTSPETQKLKLEIDPRNFADSVFVLSDIADDATYIPLDNSILVGRDHYSFKVINQKIYFGGEGSLVCFDLDGKNPVQIGNKGRGPGEYLYCPYFTADENGNIYVLGRRDAILVYSPNGRFLKEIKLPDESFFQDIDFLGSFLFIAEHIHGSMGSRYKWLIIDTAGVEVAQASNRIPHVTSRQGPSGGVFTHRGKLTYWDDKIDTVFTISADFTFEPTLFFPNGNHRIPLEGIPYNTTPQQYIEKIHDFFAIGNLIGTDNYYILNYRYERNRNIALIDKHDGDIRIGKRASLYIADAHKWGIPNDIDEGMIFQPRGYYCEDDSEYIFSIIQPFQLKVHVESESFKNSVPKYPEKKKQLEDLATSLDENDNPALMLVKLKK